MSQSRLVYLHGFASGPASRKARFFQDRLPALEVPDLSDGDFEHLTIGRQLGVLERLLQGDSAILIGSSLGGYLAALYASRHPEVKSVVMLAPAFHFARHFEQQLGPDTMARWRSTGRLPVFHYTENRMRDLDYSMVDESRFWEPEPGFSQPGHIFHGLRDTVVPAAISQAYVEIHRQIGLTLLETGHEMLDVLAEITEHPAFRDLVAR